MIVRWSYPLKKWYKHNFYPYDQECNYQCCFGVRGSRNEDYKKCKNRWRILVCGRCWRGNHLKRR